MSYMTSIKAPGCILCEKLREDRDRENLVVYRGERAFICLNLYPYSNGHLMVSPYEHVPSLEHAGRRDPARPDAPGDLRHPAAAPRDEPVGL